MLYPLSYEGLNLCTPWSSGLVSLFIHVKNSPDSFLGRTVTSIHRVCGVAVIDVLYRSRVIPSGISSEDTPSVRRTAQSEATPPTGAPGSRVDFRRGMGLLNEPVATIGEDCVTRI